jgi:stage II sporulation protein AA (anti-sigma F factor antagonist)
LSKSIRRYKEHLIVKFPKEADHHHLSSFSDKIRMEILKRGVKNIIFDFSDVTFIDSSAVGLILSKSKTVESLGGKAGLCCAKGHVLKVLNACTAVGLSKIFDNVEEAISCFEKKQEA